MGDEKLLREIGIRIKMRRRELRITQEQLAEAMDVSVQMISNLELGKKAIRPENIVKLCSALSVSADYVLRGVNTQVELTDFMKNFEKLSFENRSLVESLVRAINKSNV